MSRSLSASIVYGVLLKADTDVAEIEDAIETTPCDLDVKMCGYTHYEYGSTQCILYSHASVHVFHEECEQGCFKAFNKLTPDEKWKEKLDIFLDAVSNSKYLYTRKLKPKWFLTADYL